MSDLVEFAGILMDSEAKNYEVAYLLNPDIAEEEVVSEAGKITGFIQDAHGLVGRVEEPKKRKLAYPIGKHRNAYFGWTTFTIAPEHLPAIEQRLKSEQAVLRFLVVEEVKRPSPLFHPPRPIRRASVAPREPVAPFAPQPPKEEDKMKIEELDKRLEEILGK